MSAGLAGALLAVVGGLIALRFWLGRQRESRGVIASVASGAYEKPVEEWLSPSGKFKAVAYAHADGVFRVERFQRFVDDAVGPYWCPIGGASFVDRAGLSAVVQEALRTTGDD